MPCSNSDRHLSGKDYRRAVRYCDQGLQKYRERTKNVTDPILLRKTADNVREEEFFRETPAKKEGKKLFDQEVESDIARRSVRKKSR
jgi:hypothetical protein